MNIKPDPDNRKQWWQIVTNVDFRSSKYRLKASLYTTKNTTNTSQISGNSIQNLVNEIWSGLFDLGKNGHGTRTVRPRNTQYKCRQYGIALKFLSELSFSVMKWKWGQTKWGLDTQASKKWEPNYFFEDLICGCWCIRKLGTELSYASVEANKILKLK